MVAWTGSAASAKAASPPSIEKPSKVERKEAHVAAEKIERKAEKKAVEQSRKSARELKESSVDSDVMIVEPPTGPTGT